MGSLTPILQAFLLADHVYWDRGTGKKVVCGIFFQLNAVELPAAFPGCWAYACLTSVPPEFDYQLRLVRLSDQLVLAESPPHHIEHGPNKLNPHELVIQVPPILFVQAGAYEFELVIGDQPLKGLRFTVQLAGEKGGQDAAKA